MSSEEWKQIPSNRKKKKMASGKRAHNYSLDEKTVIKLGKMRKSEGRCIEKSKDEASSNLVRLRHLQKSPLDETRRRDALLCVVTPELWHEVVH